MKYNKKKNEIKNECVSCSDEKNLCEPVDCDELIEGENN